MTTRTNKIAAVRLLQGKQQTANSIIINLTVGNEPAAAVDGDGTDSNMTLDCGFWNPMPLIVVEKLTNGMPLALVREGDPVTWSYQIRNTGNVTLTSVSLSDDKIGPVSCPLNVLAVDQEMTCEAVGVAMSGTYTNTATAIGVGAITSIPVRDTAISGYWGLTKVITPTLTTAIGDFIWIDEDSNGLQDPGDYGAVGQKVNLIDCATSQIVTSTVTNGAGGYVFNIQPGSYAISVPVTSGIVFSPFNVGTNDAINSKMPTDGEKTTCFDVAAGQFETRVDVGLILPPKGDNVVLLPIVCVNNCGNVVVEPDPEPLPDPRCVANGAHQVWFQARQVDYEVNGRLPWRDRNDPATIDVWWGFKDGPSLTGGRFAWVTVRDLSVPVDQQIFAEIPVSPEEGHWTFELTERPDHLISIEVQEVGFDGCNTSRLAHVDP